MDKRILVALCAAVSAAALSAGAGEAPRRYPFKSAVVTYRISGSIQQGTEVFSMDDYGAKTRTERNSTITIGQMKEEDKTLEIDDGTSRYVIDLEKKTGTKMPSSAHMAEKMLAKMSPEQKKAMEKIGREIVKGLTGEEKMKPVGKGTVLGKVCEIYDVMGVNTWQWNGLVLKMESPALGNMVREAVDLKIDCPVPSDTFTPPPGVKITEVPREAWEMQGELSSPPSE